MRLESTTIALTGAAGGIGTLLARNLRKQGARVIGIDRADCPDDTQSIVADLSSQEGLASIAGQLAGMQIDILVNLAGLQYFGPVERQSSDSIWANYVVNLIAPVALTRAILPQMIARGRGQIVNIGSVLGAVDYPHFATYASSKAGLRSYSRALRREVAKDGIVVTYIAPRAVRTGFNDATVNRFLDLAKMRADDPELVASLIADAIIKRRRDVTIGVAENFYSRLNGAFPRLVDIGLAGITRKAQRLFTDP
jgi:short-subunit dehydrogenase